MPIFDFEGNASHIGFCLYESEINGYHDSDFYMTVWNPDKKEPQKIQFATTRAGCGKAFNSGPDATPEVLKEYNLWQVEQEKQRRINQRKSEAKKLLAFRADCKKAASGNCFKFYTLKRVIGADETERLLHLINGKIRNQFKLKLKAQVLDWLANPAPQYKTPLSAKQMKYI